MHENQLDDLKQFILAAMSQTEKSLGVKIADLGIELHLEMQTMYIDLRTEINEVRHEVQALRSEVLDGFAGVGEAIEAIHDQAAEQDRVVGGRLARLEESTA